MKQSSIEYLAEKHDMLIRWMEGDHKAKPYSFTDFDADLKIAREMHRVEIKEAYGEGHNDTWHNGNYYTETFNP